MNSELLNQLIDRAVAVLNQHIVPGGISDRDALSELYGIFDGPEYRVAIVAPPAPDAGISWKESEIKSALIAYALEFPLTSDGDPDVGNIHANIRALKKRADADRLDAQRYRDTRTIYCRSNGVPESDSDDQADQYIEAHRDLLATGGQT
jgi:hypothetical protein